MKIYPAIIPPAPLFERIAAFSSSLTSLGLPRITPKDDPHITLRAPQKVDNTEIWLKNFRAALENFKPFEIKCDQAVSFGNKVLALSVKSHDLQAINGRLRQLLHPYDDPAIQYRDGDAFHPHITLAYCGGLSVQQMGGLMTKVNKDLLPLPRFQATEAVVLTKKDGETQYHVLATVPFGCLPAPY